METILSAVSVVLVIIAVILLIVLLTKKGTASVTADFTEILRETKKQNEFLEKTMKNLFENQLNSTKQFDEFLISTIKNYNDNVLTYLSNLSKGQFNN